MKRNLLYIIIVLLLFATCNRPTRSGWYSNPYVNDSTPLEKIAPQPEALPVADAPVPEFPPCEEAFDSFEYQIRKQKMTYYLASPSDSVEGKKYPLIVYLHGLKNTPFQFITPYLIQNRDRYPAYILAPECPAGYYWGYAGKPKDLDPEKMDIKPRLSIIGKAVMNLIDSVTANHAVDTTRIYVLGYSMGAVGALDLAARLPKKFAAVVAFSGSINPRRFNQDIVGTSVRLYHSATDPFMPAKGTCLTYQYLWLLGADVEYIPYKTKQHWFAWMEPQSDTTLLDWLFSHSRRRPTR